MPASPEGECRIIIGYAAGHVLWWVDAVHQCPETEEPPGDQELEPDNMQIEICHHAELGRGVQRPIWGGLRDGHDVDIV